MGILVTFVPPKVTARRGMSDMPPRGTAVTHNRTAVAPEPHPPKRPSHLQPTVAKHSGIILTGHDSQIPLNGNRVGADLKDRLPPYCRHNTRPGALLSPPF